MSEQRRGRGRPPKARTVTTTAERIGLTLRTLRTDRGISGTDMAKGMDVSQAAYYQYEAGAYAMTWQQVQQAAWFLTFRGNSKIFPEALALPAECRSDLAVVAA